MAAQAKRVDLNEMAQRPDAVVELQVRSPEHPEELQARLRRQEAQEQHERRKDLAVTAAVLFGVATLMGFCIWTVGSAGSSPDDKKWATALLTSIVTAGLGYLTGKATK